MMQRLDAIESALLHLLFMCTCSVVCSPVMFSEYFVNRPDLRVVNEWMHLYAWKCHSLQIRVSEMCNSTSNPVFEFGASRATGPQPENFDA